LPKSENVYADAEPAGTPENGFLLSYPMVQIKRNGIMENVETLAGGLYKLIYDYLMFSHCAIPERNGRYPD